ncbi:protein arginine kinase [Oscillospiraceae bacterium OttesenSCG-928-F05]|nr:protein arginine kinase [Oscillospiraceae bacterium OttesenSCG-928-F05]
MTHSYWYDREGPENDIVISTRVRLARNLKGYPFPGRMSDGQDEVLSAIERALAAEDTADFRRINLHEVGENEKRALMERRAISSELMAGEGRRAVFLNGDESLSLMGNEEDHLRIQAMGSGFCLRECMDKAEQIDIQLEKTLDYAFDENLGYLTKCPTNLGTALRASVMLHLPAITESGAIRALAANAAKLGFAVRGMYGEGSAAKGALYQISNQMTLGFDEQEIIERLEDAIRQIVEKERHARRLAYEREKRPLEDRVWRAVGLLQNGRIMKSDEAIQLLSDVRLGRSIGILERPEYAALNRLIWEIQPASLRLKAKSEGADETVRDAIRADFLRGELQDVKMNA